MGLLSYATPKYVKPSGTIVYGSPEEKVSIPSGSKPYVAPTVTKTEPKQPVYYPGVLTPQSIDVKQQTQAPVVAKPVSTISEYKPQGILERLQYKYLKTQENLATRNAPSAAVASFGLGIVKGGASALPYAIPIYGQAKLGYDIGRFGYTLASSAVSKQPETYGIGEALRQNPAQFFGETAGFGKVSSYTVPFGIRTTSKLSPYYDPTLTRKTIPSTIQTTPAAQESFAGKRVKLYSASKRFVIEPGKNLIKSKPITKSLGIERSAFLKRYGVTELGIFTSPEKISQGFAIKEPGQMRIEVLEVPARIPRIDVTKGLSGRLKLIKTEVPGVPQPGRLLAGVGTELEFRLPPGTDIYLKPTLRSKLYDAFGIQRGAFFGYTPEGRTIELFKGSLTKPTTELPGIVGLYKQRALDIFKIPTAKSIKFPEIKDYTTRPLVPNILRYGVPPVIRTSVPRVINYSTPRLTRTTVPNISRPNIPSITRTGFPRITRVGIPGIGRGDVPIIRRQDVPNIGRPGIPKTPEVYIPKTPIIKQKPSKRKGTLKAFTLPRQIKFKAKYKPSLKAQLFKIKGVMPTELSVKSGLTIRPIIR